MADTRSEYLPNGEIRLYQTCSVHGEFLTDIIRQNGSTHLRHRCPACEKAQREREMWGRAAIPPRFIGKTLDGYSVTRTEQKAVVQYLRDFRAHLSERLSAGTSCIFSGNPGTGKTHLACAIGSDAVRAGKSVLFTSLGRAFRSVAATWRRDGAETEADALARFIELDLLIIDEVGEGTGSDAEKRFLFQVINERYENRRSTFLITNQSVKELAASLGYRAVDRFKDDGGRVLLFTWDSHRGKE